MADIDLVIKIPEEMYEALRKAYVITSGIRSGKTFMSDIYNAVANGTPLDKIRTEIKAMFPPAGEWMYDEGSQENTVCEVLADVLRIIDTYEIESEEQE